jgi:hypothetical protein
VSRDDGQYEKKFGCVLDCRKKVRVPDDTYKNRKSCDEYLTTQLRTVVEENAMLKGAACACGPSHQISPCTCTHIEDLPFQEGGFLSESYSHAFAFIKCRQRVTMRASGLFWKGRWTLESYTNPTFHVSLDAFAGAVASHSEVLRNSSRFSPDVQYSQLMNLRFISMIA